MYKITTFYYDYGKVEVRFTEEGDVQGRYKYYDLYIDEFETEKEALDFIGETERE